MSFWSRLTAPFRSEKVTEMLLPVGVTPGQPIFPQQNFRNNALFGYKKNEVIYACMTYKADSMSQVDLDVFNTKGEQVEMHPLELLMKKPNPHISGFDMLYMLLIDLDLAGRAYFEKVRSGSGQVVQLWRMRPDYVKPIASETAFIAAYEYDPGTGKKVILPPEDVIEFKLFDPLNIYQGQAPVSVAGRVGDVDSAGVDYLKSFFDAGGMPTGFLRTTMPVDQKVVDQIKADWQASYGGAKNWTKPAVLAFGAEYQKLGASLNDMAADKIDAKTISRIAMVLKVNPILIGAAHGLARATFNNFKTARESFWREGLIPQLKRIISVFNNRLALEDFTGVFLKWDFSGVPALQEDIDNVWKRANSGLGSGGITVNEYRQLIGLPLDRGGDVFLRTANVLEEGATIVEVKARGLQTKQDEPVAPDNNDRERREKETQEKLEKFFKGQQNRILKTVGTKAPEDLDNEFWEAEEVALSLVLAPEILTSAQLSVANTVAAFEAQFDIAIPIDLANQATANWARDYSFGLVKGITQTTRGSVSESVAAWVQNDLPRSALADEIAPLFGDVRSRAIARTETTRAFFEGNRHTWKVSGIVSGWIWRTTESACPICGPEEGGFHSLGSEFQPPAHPNCNCFAEAVIDQAAVDALGSGVQ